MTVDPLAPEALHRQLDPVDLGFTTTADLADLADVLGQDRAMAAIEFGIGIGHPGYNIFCLGSPGTGKHTIVTSYLEKAAAARGAPKDWCYVHNFLKPKEPRAIGLPAGRARVFAEAMVDLVEELRAAIPAAFESEDYRSRRGLIEQEFKDQHEQVFEAVRQEASANDIALIRTPVGIGFAPMRNGEAVKPEVFDTWAEADREKVRVVIEDLQKKMEAAIAQAPAWEKDMRTRLRDLNRQIASVAVQHLVTSTKAAFDDLPDVLDFLKQVFADVVRNAFDFLKASAEQAADGGEVKNLVAGVNEMVARSEQQSFRRYEVNVVVSHEPKNGAPVIYEDTPSLSNLVGRVEQVAQFGALTTDFTLIHRGSLHRANGGYLVLDARKLLIQPLAYEELKRALQRSDIRIETPAQIMGMTTTVTLEPEPIPLDVKVVLVGEPMIYYQLSALDPDFAMLFKVQAEFNAQLPWTEDNLQQYAQLIATLQRQEGLCPLDAGAVARIIERGVRLTGDRERLLSRFSFIFDLLREACHRASSTGCDLVTADHVQAAIDAQIYRSDRIRELSHEQIERGTMLISTEGAAVGQINGLSVLQVGSFAFGKPTRITARAGLGRGDVVDIERRVELGGPLHSKGVLILAGFLRGRFSQERPLSLTASLVFEQSYGGVDGDSASSTELYALLSTLADVPVRQGLAVTGSVNQYGQVQAIGGVNEKIEGFFDICVSNGLTGEQGVMIPEANVKHLMLRQDVVDAARDGKFRIYPVATIDEGIEILTGVAAGAQQDDGSWPEGTINAAVAARLDAYADAARRAHRGGGNGDQDEDRDDRGE